MPISSGRPAWTRASRQRRGPSLEQAAQRLTKPSEGQHGIWFHWNITGNWLFQAMVSCAGGHMVAPDEKRIWRRSHRLDDAVAM
jgi:hypothetical protein